MKKTIFSVSIVLVVAFALMTIQVMASPVEDNLIKSTKQTTPGAKATEKAIIKATDGIGKPDKANEKGGKKVNLRGVISTADATSLTILLDDGTQAIVLLTTETRLQVPTLGKAVSFADLLPGLKVTVQAKLLDDGSMTALKVSIVPGKPTRVHHVGEVTDYIEGTSISILAIDGQTYTFLLTVDTKMIPSDRIDSLAIGSLVTIISPRDVTGQPLTAAGVVIHPPQTDGE